MCATLAFAAAAAASSPLLDDTCATATIGGSIGPNGVDLVQLEISARELTDHRRYVVEPSTLITLQAHFQHASGDLQMVLWNADCSQVLGSSSGAANVEEVRWPNLTSGPVEVVLEVYLDNAQGTDVPYTLSARGVFDSCGFADVFEPNDTCATATPIPPLGTYNVSPSDEDWFTVDVLPTSTLFVRTRPGTSADVAVEIWAADCSAPIEVTPGLGRYLSAQNSSATTVQMAVRVLQTDPAGSCTSYSLDTGRSFGVTECPSPLNSTGRESVLECLGGVSLSLGDPVFRGSSFPSGATSLLVFGPDAAAIPLGSGVLCVDTAGLRRATLGRNLLDIHFFLLDADAPAPGTPPFLAGQTFRFQAWFRDPGHPTGFGLTNSLRVSFAP